MNLLHLLQQFPHGSIAEEMEEEKEEDYFFPVIKKQLRKRTLNDMSFDELAADLCRRPNRRETPIYVLHIIGDLPAAGACSEVVLKKYF